MTYNIIKSLLYPISLLKCCHPRSPTLPSARAAMWCAPSRTPGRRGGSARGGWGWGPRWAQKNAKRIPGIVSFDVRVYRKSLQSPWKLLGSSCFIHLDYEYDSCFAYFPIGNIILCRYKSWWIPVCSWINYKSHFFRICFTILSW